MKEILKEVYSSISQHKTRSILTGFGVAWGIFILIILVGVGKGFKDGVLNTFSAYASNSMWITGRKTTKSTLNGLREGKKVSFNPEIIKRLKAKFKQIEFVSAEVPILNQNTITYKDNNGKFEAKGIGNDYLKIKTLDLEKGRNFNFCDYHNKRKVLIIGSQVNKLLFGDEDAIGKYVNISGIFFQIVGILKEGTFFGIMEQNFIYMPDMVAYDCFQSDREFYTFGMLIKNDTPIEEFDAEIKKFLAKEVGFAADDDKAIYINNIQLQVNAFNSLFKGINVFLWVLGLCILLTGMIGISNIMLVVVKERSVEIGIRKAIGATPNSIIILIIAESVVITILFGIIGLLSGYGGLYLYNWIMSALQSGSGKVFARATIDGYIVFSSLLLLIISGILAGIFPAKNAAEIMPVETLNSEMAN